MIRLAALLLALVVSGALGASRTAGAEGSAGPLAGTLEAVAEPRQAAIAGDASWLWPVAGARAVIRGYSAPVTPYGPGHRGIDVRIGSSATVLAPDDGIVHFVGFVVDRPVLSIRHADGVISSFEPVRASVEQGDAVRRGESVGVAVPGHCATPCVHVGARVDGGYVSPLLFLGGIPRSVLLPPREIP